MAVSVDWDTKIITVPKADTTLVSVGPPEVREYSVDVFRLELKALEASEVGMPFLDTHRHNTLVTLGGITLARVVEIINGYTVTFESGSYQINLIDANHNVLDVTNMNLVALRGANSAGLVSLGALAAETAIINELLAADDEGVIAAGSTIDALRTDRTEVDDYWNGITVLVFETAIRAVPRIVTRYENANGTFHLSAPLPFSPTTGNRLICLNTAVPASGRVS